jgi:hypothetical protein
VDRVVLRRDAHHLRAAPGDRPQIGVGHVIRLQHQRLGGVDLGDRIGHLEVEHPRRFLEALRMRGRLEDRPAIGALTLEYRARVVHCVGKNVNLGVAPRHKLAVEPDHAVAVVERWP